MYGLAPSITATAVMPSKGHKVPTAADADTIALNIYKEFEQELYVTERKDTSWLLQYESVKPKMVRCAQAIMKMLNYQTSKAFGRYRQWYLDMVPSSDIY